MEVDVIPESSIIPKMKTNLVEKIETIEENKTMLTYSDVEFEFNPTEEITNQMIDTIMNSECDEQIIQSLNENKLTDNLPFIFMDF